MQQPGVFWEGFPPLCAYQQVSFNSVTPPLPCLFFCNYSCWMFVFPVGALTQQRESFSRAEGSSVLTSPFWAWLQPQALCFPCTSVLTLGIWGVMESLLFSAKPPLPVPGGDTTKWPNYRAACFQNRHSPCP